MATEIIFFCLNVFVFLCGVLIYYVSSKNHRVAQIATRDLTQRLDRMIILENKVTLLETEFIDKFDYAMRKFSNRQSMRSIRNAEESEDIKSPIIGL